MHPVKGQRGQDKETGIMPDYYGILGLKEEASEDEIKKAYRRIAKKYHPKSEAKRS